MSKLSSAHLGDLSGGGTSGRVPLPYAVHNPRRSGRQRIVASADRRYRFRIAYRAVGVYRPSLQTTAERHHLSRAGSTTGLATVGARHVDPVAHPEAFRACGSAGLGAVFVWVGAGCSRWRRDALVGARGILPLEARRGNGVGRREDDADGWRLSGLAGHAADNLRRVGAWIASLRAADLSRW